MKFKKMLITGMISAGIVAGSLMPAFAQDFVYKVQAGDTFWKIGQKFGVSTLNLMAANNAAASTILYPGQSLIIPAVTVHVVQAGDTYWLISQKYNVGLQELMQLNKATASTILNIGDSILIPEKARESSYTKYTAAAGDTYWLLSQKFKVDFHKLLEINGANTSTYLYIGQVIKVPIPQVSTGPVPSPSPAPAPSPAPNPAPSEPYITYKDYIVKQGDYIWGIAEKEGLPAAELMKANNINESTVLTIGSILKIPVHHIPVKTTPGEKYGELLDWWTEAQYVIPRGAVFEVVDFATGKSYMAKRTAGSNHADVEPLTLTDTNKMKEIWGGFTWNRRPVVILVNGRKIAASATSLPHAGNDSAPGGVWTTWRSDDYGAGINHDYIKNNSADGHIDIHFYNSTRHVDGQLDPAHQANIKISSGMNQ